MASPQKENGYSPIANEILEAISKEKLNGTQFRIIMTVWRFTYGFSRKKHELSVTFLVNATGITKRQIQKELQNLLDFNILVEVRQASFNQTRIIAFNKDYESWKTDTSTPKKQQVNNEVAGERLDTSTGVQKDTSTGERLDTQESNIKTNIKQEEEERKNPIVFYESNFGIMTPTQMQKVWNWVEDFGNEEVVYLAAEETALKNPRAHFPYFEKILSDWFRRKLLTVDDVLREKEKYEQEVKVKFGGHKKQNSTSSLFEPSKETLERQNKEWKPSEREEEIFKNLNLDELEY